MTKATRDSLAYFHKFCAKICLDDREFSVNYFTFIFHFATTKNYLVMPQPLAVPMVVRTELIYRH